MTKIITRVVEDRAEAALECLREAQRMAEHDKVCWPILFVCKHLGPDPAFAVWRRHRNDGVVAWSVWQVARGT